MSAELVFGISSATAFGMLFTLIAVDEFVDWRRKVEISRKQADKAMPTAAPTPCRQPGCAALINTGSYCDAHKRQVRRQQDERRGSSASRGYGHKWRQAREAFLRRNLLCVECQRQGRLTPSTDVDHIKPHRGDMSLFWSQSNWQALCHTCHSSKTAREDGGFGIAAAHR